tara:strand:+ start:9108 stop:9359 length:252 start_codon:yes stop_codon:yes gene_type:complete
MGTKIKYICIEDTLIYFDEANAMCDLKVGDIIYLTFAYHGAFEDRYLIYLFEDEDCACVGSLFGKDLKDFEEYRENIINNILK